MVHEYSEVIVPKECTGSERDYTTYQRAGPSWARVKNNPAMPWLPYLQLSQPKFSANEITNNS